MESYDLITNTETWWDKSHDWSTPTDSYKLFRRDRQERRGRQFALSILLDCTNLSLKNSNGQVNSLKIRGQANKRNLMVCVYYPPLN